MKITIEQDIDGETFEAQTYKRVITLGMVGLQETDFMPKIVSRTHIGGSDQLDALVGRCEYLKGILMAVQNGAGVDIS